MNGAHDTRLDRSVVIQSLCHRSQTVGGAGCCGNDGILSSQGLLVYAVNDGLQIVTSRSRDNYLLSASVDVSLRLLLGGVEAGALQNYVNTDLAPRKILCILLFINCNLLAIYGNGVFSRLNGVLALANVTSVSTLSGIILQQVCQHLRIG